MAASTLIERSLDRETWLIQDGRFKIQAYRMDQPRAPAQLRALAACLANDLGALRAEVAAGYDRAFAGGGGFIRTVSGPHRHQKGWHVESCLEAACLGGSSLCCAWLLQGGANARGSSDPNGAYDDWPLFYSFMAGSRECAGMLLERGAQVPRTYGSDHGSDNSLRRLLKRWGLLQRRRYRSPARPWATTGTNRTRTR